MSLDGKINYNYAGYQLKFDPSKTSSTIMDFNTPKPKVQQAKYTNTQIGNIWGQPTSRIYTSSQNGAPVFSQYTTPTLSQNAAPIFNQQPKVYTPVQNTAPLFSQYTTPTLSQNAAPIFNQPTNTLNVQPPLTQSTNLTSNIPAKPQNAYSGSLPPVKNGDMYGKFLAENPVPQATPIQLIDENKAVADKPITGDTDAGKQAKPKRVKTAEQRAAQLRKIRSNPRARSLYKRLKLKNKKLISKLGGKIMFEKIQEMMVESLSLEKDDIKLESTFESLEIDSLDVFELVTEIEEEFDIEIEDAENLKSVQDLVAYIEGKVAVK